VTDREMDLVIREHWNLLQVLITAGYKAQDISTILLSEIPHLPPSAIQPPGAKKGENASTHAPMLSDYEIHLSVGGFEEKWVSVSLGLASA
jgi:hypothetical protein